MARGENYGQFLSMLDLALWLQGSGEGVTLAKMQDRFGVTRRTAERMRDAMAGYFAADFVERREGTQKYYRLRSPRLDSLTLSSITLEELASLGLAARLLRAANLEAQAENVERAGDKLRGLMRLKNSRLADLADLARLDGLARRPGPSRRYDRGIVAAIRQAMMGYRQIRILYQGPKGDYEPELIPLGILYGERRHYLVARYADGHVAGPRHFALDKILLVTEPGASFEEDPGFSLEDHAARSFGSFQEEPVEVEWLFSPEAAAEAASFVFHPSQTQEANPDGSLTVKFRSGGLLEMSWHLNTWDGQVKVVRPADFWERLPG
ncbi:MAG: WYL domain-containing protein [Deltaproteobacteria bacterium]|jgi:predicted DNA-binding transcriptional regulator YafY|nr:WYL domain-containing protein [Deltaproteobacteria bacterium]